MIHLSILSCCLLVLAGLTPARAQTETAPRQTRPLFGGAEATRHGAQSLDVYLSLLGGYDDNVALGASETESAVGDPRFQRNSSLSNGQASLTYQRGRARNWLRAGARTAFRFYPDAAQLNSADHAASIAFSANAGRRWLLMAGQNVSYFPYFAPGAVQPFAPDGGGALPISTIDYAVSKRPSLAYVTNARVGYLVAPRTQLYSTYLFRGLDFLHEYDQRQRQHGAAAGLARNLTRRVTLGTRYSYDYSDISLLGPRTIGRSHTGELTVDYRRALTAGRSIGFGVDAGFSYFTLGQPGGDTAVRRRPSAGARMRVELGRGWTASADYLRGLISLPGISQPFYSDVARASVGGLWARRLDTTFSAAYSSGESQTGFSSLNGAAQCRVAINRLSAVSASYIYYRYQFGSAALLPPGIGPRLNRHGVRAGIDIWLPLYR